MKNVFKSFALLFSITLIFASCSDNTTFTEDQDYLQDKPLEDNQTMDDVVILNPEKRNQSCQMPNIIVPSGLSCPAFNNAHSQYLAVNGKCNYGYLYCEYLKLFWLIDLHTAALNCGWPFYCNPMYNDFQVYAACQLVTLASQGLHVSYQQSLGNKILAHQAAFNNNC